ncbi:MAG: Crp/Fnr family transcriptional regulator [Polyangiaceae bacterium]|nr:Crp/Fnr family transcriptional regulator [Polyangiaceae bacterium]
MDRSTVRGAEGGDTGGGAASGQEGLLDSSPFAGLTGVSREVLLAMGTVERFARKQRILQQGEPVRALFLLGDGRVKLERVGQGRSFSIGHRGPGEIVGETGLVTADAASENATAVDETAALVLPLAGLRRLVATDPSVRACAAAVLVRRQLEAEARLASLLSRTVEARLAEFLTAAARRWGQPHPSGEIVAAPFTHVDMALLIGSTRETVTLLLGRLKRAGLIAFDRRRIVIRDAAALAQRAGAT